MCDAVAILDSDGRGFAASTIACPQLELATHSQMFRRLALQAKSCLEGKPARITTAPVVEPIG